MVGWYNDVHLHSGIRFVTPSQRHGGLDRGNLVQAGRGVQGGEAEESASLVGENA